MNVIKVSNIMGIDPKPFDPKTYVEEDAFVTDESGTKKRIRLEDNIVRWRTVRNADGTTSVSGMLSMYQLVLEFTNILMILGLTSSLCLDFCNYFVFNCIFPFFLFGVNVSKESNFTAHFGCLCIGHPSNYQFLFESYI